MNSVAKIVMGILWKYVVAQLSEEELNKCLEEVVTEWAEKHLTVKEITSEVKDFGKLLKGKLKK